MKMEVQLIKIEIPKNPTGKQERQAKKSQKIKGREWQGIKTPATKQQHSRAQVEQRTGGQEKHAGNTGAEQSNQQRLRRKPKPKYTGDD